MKGLSVFALSAILIASIGLTPAFGQIVEPIVVTTDKTSYDEGDIIMVTGEVKELVGFPISLQLLAPNGSIVTVAQLEVGPDKRFSKELPAGGQAMKAAGEYTIIVQQGTETRTDETTFTFTGSSMEPKGTSGKSMTVEGTDFMVGYTITGGKLLSIMPDIESNSLVIEIEATDNGSITLTLPRELIDAKIGDEDDDFFVIVDGEEWNFDETKTAENRTLTIDFYPGTEIIEIIGTFVIPEFGAIAALILAVAIISIVAVSAKSRLSIIPRY